MKLKTINKIINLSLVVIGIKTMRNALFFGLSQC